MSCPTQDELRHWVFGRIHDAQIDAISNHLSDCDNCTQFVERLDGETDELICLARSADSGAAVSNSFERMMQDVAPLMNRAQELDKVLDAGQIRDYQLLEPLGRGGMGAVYRAMHTRLKREVAVKLLLPRRAGSVAAVEHFQREMEAVGRLDHPNIVRALDAGEHEEVPYLVMELVSGRDAQAIVDENGPMDVADACEIVRQAAMGLQYAHEQGIVHRDVKPSNLMLADDGNVLVMDLGLARLQSELVDPTQDPMVLGSYSYMAPEQLENSETATPSSDVYGLGGSLYFLLGGQPPHLGRPTERDRMFEDRLAAKMAPIETLRTGLPSRLVSTLGRMLDTDPASRISSASDVAKLLAPFTRGANLSQSRGSHGRLLNRLFWPAVVAAVGTLFCVAIFFHFRFMPSVADEMQHWLESPVKEVTYRLDVVSEGRSAIVSVCPGEEIAVRIQNESGGWRESRGWDLLELRLEHEDAFALYQRYWPDVNERDVFPHDGQEAPMGLRSLSLVKRSESGRLMVESRDDVRSLRLLELANGEVLVAESIANGAVTEYRFDSIADMDAAFDELAALIDGHCEE